MRNPVKLLSLLGVFVAIVLVVVSGVSAWNKAKEPTLRDILSNPVPMVASFEVIDKYGGEYKLANVNGDKTDIDTYALEGAYQVGDVVTVLFATKDSTEIAGDVKVGKTDELDLPHKKR